MSALLEEVKQDLPAYFRDFFRDQLTEKPSRIKTKLKIGRSTHLGWVFLTNVMNHKPKSVRTYSSLYDAAGNYTYFTPNTFFHSESRDQASLRWINTVSIDFDVKPGTYLSVAELLDLIEEAGLPYPSLIVQTPSGGYHIHWYLSTPRRAFKNVITHYKRVVGLMIDSIGGDQKANGPERYFRVPTEQNIKYQSNNRIDFDELCDWYSIEVERLQEERLQYAIKPGFNLFSAPAVQYLLKGVAVGKRDNTCYTLALACKSIGLDAQATEERLIEWNKNNEEPMLHIDIKRKVKSAFKPNAPKGPAARFIRELSGMPFSYQVWDPKKERTARKYSHYDEWEKDVLSHIRFRGGFISGSQRSLAEEIRSSVNKKQEISFATLKRVIKRLEDQGLITKTVSGLGRGAVTTLTILEQVEAQEQAAVALGEENSEATIINELNSNTPIAGVVGRPALPIPLEMELVTDTKTTSSSFVPAPSQVPDRFVSALWNRGFTDGRFVFGAWGKVQLAFKAFHIPFKAISLDPGYLQLINDAVGATVGAKGSIVNGNFSDQDSFYKYLYGAVKGMLANYRTRLLNEFIQDVEDADDERLDEFAFDLATLLKTNNVDKLLVQAQLDELEAEIQARIRRKSVTGRNLLSFLKDYLEEK